jgi:diacylglycerol kinase family enzyme
VLSFVARDDMLPIRDHLPTRSWAGVNHLSSGSTRRRRLAALAALALGLAAVVILLVLAIHDRGRGMLAFVLVLSAVAVAWQGLRRHGRLRLLALAAGGVMLAGFFVLLIARQPLLVIGLVAALALATTAGRYALWTRVSLPSAPRPRHPVLFYNPRSGGGKAARFHLVDEARARAIEAIELAPGSDLARLVRQALDAGADALAMAGGDGSQATVAAIAGERGVPYACIPAGTRNHFAVDLGVDRDDVVGALDALVDGGERVVDLGEINGRVFVNNVSVGLYGEAVQHGTYRNAKIRTLLETVPDVLGPKARTDLRWRGPDGGEHAGSVAIVVSNNPYRLEAPVGAGGRPRLDQGLLGVAMLGEPDADGELRAWATPSFEIEAQAPVPAGVDGEAVVFDPPLRFRVRRGALRCRIARHHPGASPAALAPERARTALRLLVGIAAGRDPAA